MVVRKRIVVMSCFVLRGGSDTPRGADRDRLSCSSYSCHNAIPVRHTARDGSQVCASNLG